MTEVLTAHGGIVAKIAEESEDWAEANDTETTIRAKAPLKNLIVIS